MTLDAAKPLLSQVEPLQDRAGLFGDMAQAYRICDGEADTSLLRDGFALVARIRDEGNGAAPGESGSQNMAVNLEAILVSELAHIDFGSAMRYVRSMPEKPLRVGALLRIVHSLRGDEFY